MDLRSIGLCVAAVAATVGGGAPTAAAAGEPGRIPPGIYTMYRGSDSEAELINTTSSKQCWAMPLVVYEDGLWIGRRLQSLAEIQKTGVYYATLGTSTVVSQKGASIEIRAENGLPGSGDHVQMRSYEVRPGKRGSVVLISADGKDDRVLASCMMPRFDIPGSDGRNYFDELTKRPDGRPAGIATPWRG
ncbi:MAG: hypothetical protein LWW93_15435 [Hyphomicrobiales bacterium]|nr:hypothetical protein [Hyphomicrobiales bacterium]